MKNTKKDSKKKVPQIKKYKFPARLSYLVDDLKTRLEVEQEELIEIVLYTLAEEQRVIGPIGLASKLGRTKFKIYNGLIEK